MAVFPNSCLQGLLILILLQLLDSAHFDVIGPPEPILAMVGEYAELPCHLSPNVSAEHMELRWFRNTFSPAVLVHRDGQEQQKEQMSEYQGRVMLVEDGITKGHVAVRILGVMASDAGVYGCSFRYKEAHKEAFLHLKVAALGSDPHIHMEVQKSGEIRLECTSVGWYPEPLVQWRTSKGQKFPSTSESRNPDKEGLFTVAASLIIRDTSLENMSCCIQNLLLGQEKEVGISIPAPLFPIWKTLMLLSVSLGLVTIGIFCIWKCYKKSKRDSQYGTVPIDWELARLHAVDVTLDRDTAYPSFFLYKDSKSARLEDSHQELPENPERFDSWPCVLGCTRFTRGSHYWEVEVGGRTDWLVGVCRENVMRKGFILMTPKSGFWVIELSGKEYWALNPLRTPLFVRGALHRVGIFLDYESGTISFYNISDRSHIYTFPKESFSGPLRPILCLWSCDDKPLTICPIVDGPPEVTVLADVQELSKHFLMSPMGGPKEG
ncbi:butyrophilin subfamily 1 member A1-like [Cynocephalus volans]|uniref:butyrophilin subfamily 1 member A1-like n=1 Tax=Cynocephalus volans TaxID=110931 RepID=UPI002FCBE2EB